MYRLSYGILRSRADAEDAVSEAVLKAWENLDRLKNPESFKAWIMQITANEARKLYRHAQRVSCAESLEERESVSFEDERHALWDAVMKLDEGYRAVIILYFYERLSIKEIGPPYCGGNSEVKAFQGKEAAEGDAFVEGSV